ncbi:MAG TPA: hypothetical protein VFM38_12600 [Candidatus Limnocylindrales bacterium]|nr:hypothetical protein [Candidatus Limnocylindrales bacterium]
MKRSAFPFVCGRSGRVLRTLISSSAALAPAAFEAGAVVGEDALDLDPVAAVEAVAGLEEGERGVGGLVRVDASEAEPCCVVDRHEHVLPACLAHRSFRAVTGDAVTG